MEGISLAVREQTYRISEIGRIRRNYAFFQRNFRGNEKMRNKVKKCFESFEGELSEVKEKDDYIREMDYILRVHRNTQRILWMAYGG